MKSKDFYEIGEELQKIVQTAIDSNNFKELNEMIRTTVNHAVESIKEGVKTNQISKGKNEEIPNIDGNKKREIKALESRYFTARPTGNLLGGVMVFFGFSTAVILAIVLIGLFILDMVLEGISLLIVPMIVLSIFIILLLFMGVKGQIMRARVKRFKKYRRILEGREFCSIEELSGNIGKSYDYVIKDLYRMIDLKWFLQGHIDAQEKHLIITDKMYEQYTLAMESLKQRQKKAKEEAEKMADPKYTEEVRQMLLEGKRFVDHIRECNDAIPGIEISEKMSRLELIVSRLFAQVEKNPSVASEMHQFMTYYLPTTEKLLDAYRELDVQPVQGQNIIETKKEIEVTLDTLNQAFEKLLDNFYRDMAWDVTTDISVLNTMLAKEGLTDDAMTMESKAQ